MNTLWYNQPAKDWNEALPVGNGRIGAMVYGRPGHEIIQLNEESVWSGCRHDRNNRNARENLGKIRELISQGQIQKAQELAFESMSGTPTEQSAYQTAGELHIDCYTPENPGITGPTPDTGLEFQNCTAYRRELDLETAIATTTFNSETSVPSTAIFSRNTRGSSISYTREVFASRAMDVLIIHFSANTPKSINFRAWLDRGIYAGRYYSIEKDTLIMQDSHGIPFTVMATAVSSGGTVRTCGGTIIVEGADDVTLFVDIQTAYRKKHYAKKGGNLSRGNKGLLRFCTDRALKKICFASSGVYQNIKAYHVSDSSRKFKKISLDLTSGLKENNAEELSIPTDELLVKHPDSPALAELYWNYSRYLMLSSSSKPGTLPATLQGIWNGEIDPPWGSRYTVNINTEMNYWPAGMCRLLECEKPLFTRLKRAYKNGKQTARIMYGSDGYVIHHNTDIWGDTAPQGNWIPGSYWPMGAAWLATHIRDYYEYTLDRKFLKKNFKYMVRACEFFQDTMVPSADGKYLVVSPTVSPENSFALADGQKGSFCAGCDMDNRILEHLVSATIQSALDLGKLETDPIVLGLKQMLKKIEGPVVKDDGTLREWPVECTETEPGHRHLSHLYGLYPGNSINIHRTPELAKAAEKSIRKRVENGSGQTGWSLAWIMNFWASLEKSEDTASCLKELFEKSTYLNLLDKHPPFQIDGNFGTLAAMTRMIVQSEVVDGIVVIELLPALPKKWESGSLKNVAVKGNLSMDISWKGGTIESALLYARSGSTYMESVEIYYQDRMYKAPLTDGKLDIKNILPTTI
ncbi:MAG: glycoside hydrolase family 95 protein [Treponema sp.]|nr:glycoside hydrolase family 95 protein [Treponema sp.]